MRWLQKIFVEHPASVNETYFEHLGAASSFGLGMIAAGLACLVHGLVPCCFRRTGSDQIRRLHERMVTGRVRVAGAQARRAANGGV